MAEFKVSTETQEKIEAFVTKDQDYQKEREAFEEKYSEELKLLEALREDRNACLDAATRALRGEAFEADITQVKVIKAGPFVVQKKWRDRKSTRLNSSH